MTTNAVATLESRVLNEGYGPGAWHGSDLKAALADVQPALAFWRPAAGRHNIAEIAMHHAFYVHSVRSRLSEHTLEAFALKGEDWFPLASERAISWPDTTRVVDTEQSRLATLVGDIDSGRVTSPLSESERLALVLGITCHAVYHAGQIQLLKRLALS